MHSVGGAAVQSRLPVVIGGPYHEVDHGLQVVERDGRGSSRRGRLLRAALGCGRRCGSHCGDGGRRCLGRAGSRLGAGVRCRAAR
jgi:hypothetical protein